MASKNKHSEGIALLSMYNDEDDEMEGADEEETEDSHLNGATEAGESEYKETCISPLSEQDINLLSVNDQLTPKIREFLQSTTQKIQLSPLDLTQQKPPEPRRTRKGELTIVDYGHDEAALSPEHEEGEIWSTDQATRSGKTQAASGTIEEQNPSETVPPPSNIQSPQYPKQFDVQPDPARVSEIDAKVSCSVGDDVEAVKDIDILDKFLPPPPATKCSPELQEKINKFLSYKRIGKSFNAEVRNRKEFRNPDFLLHAVTYQGIDEIGSCFSKDLFDPHGYDKSDFYDEIEADMRREMERKEQEKKQSKKVDFISGGMQPGNTTAAPKINMPISGFSNTAVSSGAIPASNASDLPRAGRHNKKSKWDKVDGDNGTYMPSSIRPDYVGANPALQSATSAGAGYTAFAQQKRREAEERRCSMEVKLERRS